MVTIVCKNYSFDLYKGEDWDIECQYCDSALSPLNISGAFFEGDIRKTSRTGVLVENFVITDIDLTIGRFDMALTYDMSDLFPDETLYYDVEMTWNGKKYRILEGTINVIPNTTI